MVPTQSDLKERTSDQPQGLTTDSKSLNLSPGVSVHASSATEETPTVKMQPPPKVTCFGFRRKSQGKGKLASQSSASTSMTGTSSDNGQIHTNSSFEDTRPASTCGAGSILESFGTDFFAEFFEARARKREGAALEKNGTKSVAETQSEDISATPKIMASYDSISLASQTDFQIREVEVQDGFGARRHPVMDGSEREEGADSIDEEEKYDTFGTPQWTVDPHDIFFISRGDGTQKICRLGKGEYGPVYLGIWQDQEVAVKLARQAPISLRNERQFQSNIARLHSLSHPNVVSFLGACCWKGGKRSVIVTEFMDKSDLRMLLGRPDLAPKFAWGEHGQTVALDVAHGLAYLHSQGIVHGRLKSTNVLMNRAGVAKLADVSLVKLLSHCKTGSEKALRIQDTPLDPETTPPEAVGSFGTMPGDVFSFGVILHELLTQERPLGPLLRPIRTPCEAPAKVAFLVECCLDPDPAQRPSMDRVLQTLGGKK